jgi:anthranilate synthase/aminodeoxychorismate synthase-like glutamine amidotransferase
MRVLFLENDDSFSWNVIDALPVDRGDVVVRPGREVALDLAALDGADVVVIGPGPTDPARAGLVGVVGEAERRGTPLLGICLGFQAIGLAHGARLVRVPPVHGRAATVGFAPGRTLPGIAGPFRVMRYHSLALADVPPPLRVLATSEDGLPMAIEHATLPVAGFQFHPDSFGTPRGRELVAAFFEGLA